MYIQYFLQPLSYILRVGFIYTLTNQVHQIRLDQRQVSLGEKNKKNEMHQVGRNEGEIERITFSRVVAVRGCERAFSLQVE